MKIDIRPLAEVDPDRVRSYLQARGMSREIVDWKYFDQAFNRGRARGYCWVRSDEVHGFLGIVPFTLLSRHGPAEAAWTCDWSIRDPESSPGAGILLLRHAAAQHARLFAFAGNDMTRRLLPRLARQTFPDAGVTLHLPLRLAFAARALGPRMPRLPRAVAGLARSLGRLPLRLPRRALARPVAVHRGLPSDLDGRLAVTEAGAMPRPWYDASHLRWQLERCPGVEVWSFSAPRDDGQEGTFGLAWRAAGDGRYWRIALLGNTASAQARQIVAAAHGLAYRLGGWALSTIASELDAKALGLFRSAGFRPVRTRKPLFVCALPAAESLPGPFAQLNHCAADLAHRF